MKNLSIVNWSLNKLLSTESDSLERAKIKILFSLLILSLSKVIVVIITAWYYQQDFQLNRSVIFGVIYLILFKLLLSKKISISKTSHFMVWVGLVVIWSNIFIKSGSLSLVIIQFIFMLIMSSFYLIGSRVALIASILACLPVMINLLYDNKVFSNKYTSDFVASPGYEILVILNFLTVIIAHYFFNEAFKNNMSIQKELNKKLEIAVEEANKAAQSKSDFLSAMSHELRTPLNAVIGMTNLFLSDPKSYDQQENLKILQFSSLNLQALINDVLDFNKLNSDKLGLNNISFNLYEQVQNICATMKFQFEEKKINLMIDLDEQLKSVFIISDSLRITQILYNLLGNALKFTAKGNVMISLKIIDRSQSYIKINFAVADTGIGITKDKQEIIFEPFIQASSTVSKNYGGTGLGLAIVKRLLQLFESSISLESQPNLGSKFFFNINFKIGDAGLVTEVKNTDILKEDLSHLKILVAEDHVMNRLLLKKVLNKWNNQPTFAENGLEAIAKLKEEDFDIILMDLYMPELDGYHAAQFIRNMQDGRKSRIPILAFTASVSDTLILDIKAAGMNDCLSKPFDPQELYRKIYFLVNV